MGTDTSHTHSSTKESVISGIHAIRPFLLQINHIIMLCVIRDLIFNSYGCRLWRNIVMEQFFLYKAAKKIQLISKTATTLEKLIVLNKS